MRRLDSDLRIKMKSLNMDVISNDNVEVDCLGKVGFHLNLKGAGRLSFNYITTLTTYIDIH